MPDDEKPFLIQIQNADPAKVSIEDTAKQMAEDLPAIIRLTEMKAKVQWHQYNTLIKEGFDENQALFMVK